MIFVAHTLKILYSTDWYVWCNNSVIGGYHSFLNGTECDNTYHTVY